LGDRLIAVVLFGSRARGDADPASDWDLLAERLAYLRSLIREQGLYRIQMGRDMAWHWERPPGLDWSLEWRAGQ
jgi:hypothetical protein